MRANSYGSPLFEEFINKIYNLAVVEKIQSI